MKLTDKYRKVRSENPRMSAINALRLARHVERERIDWQDSAGGAYLVATWSADDFDIRATVMMDEYAEVDWLGTIDKRPMPGSIRIKAPRNWRERFVYFKPEYTYADHYGSLRREHSRQESHELARRYVRNDAARLLEYYDGERALLCVRVTASRCGVELGSMAIGGIDVDNMRDPYIDECARDAASEAISQAKDALRSLCGCKQERLIHL